MVANIVMGFNPQTAKNFPMYVVTCYDNELSPNDPIEIMPFHERSDADAIAYVADLASKNEWHTWEIYNDTYRYEVYKINTNTKTEWSVLDRKKKKKKGRSKKHGKN